MTLLSASQLRNIQKIGEKGMNQLVKIYRKDAQAKDPSDPYGDEIVTFGATPTEVMGWLVTKPTEQFDMGGGEVRTIATHTLRVPVGTSILAGDRVEIGGEQFAVTDATNEQSWPEWTTAYVRGYEASG